MGKKYNVKIELCVFDSYIDFLLNHNPRFKMSNLIAEYISDIYAAKVLDKCCKARKDDLEKHGIEIYNYNNEDPVKHSIHFHDFGGRYNVETFYIEYK